MNHRPTKQALLTLAEEYSAEYNRHLGACLVQAGKAWKAWRKRGGYPPEWEESLRVVWLNDEALYTCTKKADYRRHRAEGL